MELIGLSPHVHIGACLIFLIAHCIYTSIHRLWFHPLSTVPGPRVAAITYGWLMYWNWIRGGRFVHQLPSLHRKYGPVVRITPTEVHIQDPELYHEIYRQDTPYLKSASLYNGFGFPTSTFALRDPIAHRTRRSTIAPLFSQRSVDALQSHIYEVVDTLCAGIRSYSNDDQPVPLQSAFYCMTVDVISLHAFGKSFGMTSTPGFTGERVDMVLSFTNDFWGIVHFPILAQLCLKFPRTLGRIFAKPFLDFRKLCENLIHEFLAAKPKDSPQPNITIFDALTAKLSDTDDSESVAPSFDDLVDEAISLLAGGTDTTAEIMTYCIYYFLTEAKPRERLLEELSDIPLDENHRLPLKVLQQKPYLTAFIKEVLRAAHATPGRLPRTVPHGGLTIPSTEHYLPAGTTVSIAHMTIHQHPEIFEKPMEFNPQRWIDTPGLDRWLMSFSKGTRACLGRSLAMAEMYVAFATIITRFDLVLWETTPEDMQWVDQAVVHTIGKLKVKAKSRV